MPSKLVHKYNVPGPRYTSYPTVPYWEQDGFSYFGWNETAHQSFTVSNDKEGISLYIHLPFCESMCTFCGCNKRITKNHGVEQPYIKALLKEFSLYINVFGKHPVIKELHLGGGTPTFFSPESLRQLLSGIFTLGKRHAYPAYSFEGHPNNTSKAHLAILAQFGFDRVCYGVQDYNLEVQKAINRIQPFKNVARVTYEARECGYTSVGHDIIYGLPFQKIDDVRRTIEKTMVLRPDRIAFYSYAHVPWIKGNGQRGFCESNLPSAKEKQCQYELGKKMLREAGYLEIGMDHYALPSDTLAKAKNGGTLHRNFMGYASGKTQLMLGLGVSAISDSWYGFAQNEKRLEAYYSRLDANEIPVFRGHLLSDEDLIVRRHILNLMCRFETKWSRDEGYFLALPDVLIRLKEMEEDQLVLLDQNSIKVTHKGQAFVRNICMAFDLKLQRRKPETQLFSMTV